MNFSNLFIYKSSHFNSFIIDSIISASTNNIPTASESHIKQMGSRNVTPEITPNQLMVSCTSSCSESLLTRLNKNISKNAHVRVLDFNCTPNRFRLSEIDENKIDSIDVLSQFFTEQIIDVASPKPYGSNDTSISFGIAKEENSIPIMNEINATQKMEAAQIPNTKQPSVNSITSFNSIEITTENIPVKLLATDDEKSDAPSVDAQTEIYEKK